MKLLCICPIGIGNYLLFYPACKLLKKYRPEISLHMLALRKPIADLGKGDPLWDKIHIIDPTTAKGLRQKINFIKTMRSESYNASLSFFPSNTWQYNLFPFLAGIPQRYAFRYLFKKMASLSFLNNRFLQNDISLHDVHQNMKLSGLFLRRGVDQEELVFPELCSEKEILQASEMLKGSKLVKVAIHPGSSKEHGMDAKRWAPERFGFLADRICDALGAESLIFGGADELDIKMQTASVMKMPHRIIDPVNLRMTAALMKSCTVCLCNDSGLMHIAACAGTPVFAVFGPTDEKRNGPVGAENIVIRKEMDGFPLWTAANVGKRAVPEGVDPQASLKALTVEEAWGMVEPRVREIGVRGQSSEVRSQK
jgi:ADP-heptose:LPS heptosyltransferase